VGGDFTAYYVVFFDFMLCYWQVEIRPSDAFSLSRDSVLHSSKTKQN
jgi:hypothetical protein